MGHISLSSPLASWWLCYNCRREKEARRRRNRPMSSQPTTEEREVFYLSLAEASVLYLTLITGYLFTLLTATRLTLLNFLMFTALQVCYGALLWWMIRVVGKSPKKWPLPLTIAG